MKKYMIKRKKWLVLADGKPLELDKMYYQVSYMHGSHWRVARVRPLTMAAAHDVVRRYFGNYIKER